MCVSLGLRENKLHDKVTKLAKRLEDLILLAENNQRDEARQGVRMAEDSADAVEEGQASGGGKQEERDGGLISYSITTCKRA